MPSGQQIKVYRGYIARSDNNYLPPTNESRVNLRDLYQKQLDGNKVDISSNASTFTDEIYWASTEENIGFSVNISLSRYLTQFALNKDFRDAFRKDPLKFMPAMTIGLANVDDTYIFTEGGDMRIYPYADDPSRTQKGHLLVQDIESSHAVTKLINPLLLGVRLSFVYNPGKPGDSETNWRIIGDILKTAGYSDKELSVDFMRKLVERENGQTRSLFESLNIAYAYGLEKLAANKSSISPEQLMDVAARGISQMLYYYTLTESPGYWNIEAYSQTPEQMKTEDNMTRADRQLLQDFLPPELDITILERQRVALGKLRGQQETTTELHGPSGEGLG